MPKQIRDTQLDMVCDSNLWWTRGPDGGSTFQADIDNLENQVMPKLRLPPLIPAHVRKRDREFWTKVLKERKKPERAELARRVDSSLT
ncbi:hypothetical protein JCM10295v2_006808 [Rhodotorula toruloides]